MKSVLSLAAALLFTAATVSAQDSKGNAADKSDKKAKTEKQANCSANCKQKGKSCCQQPSKTANLRVAAAAKKAQ
ncbi:hypothetical protein [Chitinophaga vietnamensis]|uniref:hypothetical protein n=1 Tax=Chitinophaga vietnamensis TaxID=2593957 RepID=UPI001177F712|nr:hypothetical protein [Chitinophaga vietnamensis]